MHTIVFKPEVYDDIKTAYDWYESQRSGLGEDFLLTLEASYANIVRNPQLYQEVCRSVRRKLIRRFPYGIFFVLREDTIRYCIPKESRKSGKSVYKCIV